MAKAVVDALAAGSSALPARGRPWAEIERTLLERRLQDPRPREGAPEVYWPNVPDPAFHAARAAQAVYAHVSAFVAFSSPGYARIDQELRQAVGELLGAPSWEQVTLTAGGTEGNFLAVRAAREWRRNHRPTAAPNVVLPYTAHPSLDKAAYDLGVTVRRVPTTPDREADVAAMAAAIDADTVLIVGSVPSFCHGTIDDIPALGALAAERDVWLHVDGAVGGFLAPWMRELDPTIPQGDLRVPGVRSITADLHKFGCCLYGISTFSLARADDLRWQRFTAEGVWPYGTYSRSGFLGSRPGGVVAAAWATFQALGHEGYRAIAAEIAARQRHLAEGMAALPGMSVVQPPRLGIFAAAPADPALVPALVAGLAERGWIIADIADPPALQFLLSPAFDTATFLAAFAEVLAEARSGVPEVVGATPVYGNA
jgi:glutamate/tyrosine decarboxylase-like PLP-dependent enzyme